MIDVAYYRRALCIVVWRRFRALTRSSSSPAVSIICWVSFVRTHNYWYLEFSSLALRTFVSRLLHLCSLILIHSRSYFAVAFVRRCRRRAWHTRRSRAIVECVVFLLLLLCFSFDLSWHVVSMHVVIGTLLCLGREAWRVFQSRAAPAARHWRNALNFLTHTVSRHRGFSFDNSHNIK